MKFEGLQKTQACSWCTSNEWIIRDGAKSLERSIISGTVSRPGESLQRPGKDLYVEGGENSCYAVSAQRIIVQDSGHESPELKAVKSELIELLLRGSGRRSKGAVAWVLKRYPDREPRQIPGDRSTRTMPFNDEVINTSGSRHRSEDWRETFDFERHASESASVQSW